MASPPLQPEQRQTVLAALWNVLHARQPELFERGKLKQPGGVIALDEHLDALVDIARQMTADRIEPCLARLIDDVCVRCPQQGVSGYCPLRHAGECALFSNARLILETIDSKLRELRDPEYLAVHEDPDAA